MRIPRPIPPAPDVLSEPWQPNLWAIVLMCAAMAGLLGGLLVALFFDRGPLDRYEYHLWRWEADTLASNMFARLGIGPDPDAASGDEAIRNYFRLTSQVRAAQDADPIDLAAVDALNNERSIYESDVERYVEGLISDAVAAAGLERSLPLFGAVKIVWPPVDFKLTTPPRLLIRSPRDHIQRAGDTLLTPGLTLREIENIERKTDTAKTVSIVVPIGGLAAYPAIVSADRSFDGWLDTTAHEWVHHYLAFYPLGEQWGNGGDAETLNETTANIAGRAIADLIRERHPIDLRPGEDGGGPPQSCAEERRIDFGKEMRGLRLDVDRLFAEGKVAEAEKTMEEKRLFFEQHCIFIRKLNQAYFAFYGTYADGPASSNPIGPKIERVWELTGDVGAFLRVMREIRNPADLDRSLAALEGTRRP